MNFRCADTAVRFGALVFGVMLSGCGRDSAPQPAASGPVDTAALVRTGEQVYQKHCAVCHMPDGSGVPNFQPPLVGSAIVNGDPATLELVIRAGTAGMGEHVNEFGTEMPPFGMLNDNEVKALVAFTRERFGTKEASP